MKRKPSDPPLCPGLIGKFTSLTFRFRNETADVEADQVQVDVHGFLGGIKSVDPVAVDHWSHRGSRQKQGASAGGGGASAGASPL